MSRTTPKSFQDIAMQSGLSIFAECKRLLDAAPEDATSRAATVSQHGMLLLEAPTGAGKTLIAGHLIEKFSANEGVVWFWFAPFKGVTGQTASALRAELPGLRLRELSEDRQAADSRTGDVFVTTWQTVATKAKDNRNVHRPGEMNLTVEELVAGLRDKKLRVGVVVDEAHHGFFGAGAETQAMKFFREVLRPEYTVLVTATPDDADIARFQQSLGKARLNRITISRHEPVAEGLIKEGVKCVAYFAPPGQEALVDYEDVALRDGVALHNKIKDELKKLRVPLTPLLLVQVDSKDKSAENAKERLKALGFTEAQIAVHTAEEPDSGLLALANDETREVLVFKMAVALGFDAPRAFTLVSMRAARDEDFGVQLVGRILRVHRRLQSRAYAKTLPPALRYGYVLLADAEAQTGLDLAGQRINKLQTEYAKVSPTTAIVQMGGQAHVQVLGSDGQLRLLPVTLPPGFPLPPPGTVVTGEVQGQPGGDYSGFTLELLTGGYTPLDLIPEEAKPKSSAAATPGSRTARGWSYPLRGDVPRRFKTQVISPDNDVTEEECAQKFIVSSQEILRALVAKVKVEKRTLELFTHQIELEFTNAAMDPEQAARIAYKVLTKNESFDARELRRALLKKLKATLSELAMDEAGDGKQVAHMLNVILCARPDLLVQAQKAALAKHFEVAETEESLPTALENESPLPASRLNVYKIMPPGLNTWEKPFAELLDRDTQKVVRWWHRNEPHKPWSVQVVLDSGKGFFPDFVIGIEGRETEDGGLLADPKFFFEITQEQPKTYAEHPIYGRVLILSLQGGAQWMTVRYDDHRQKAILDGEFRLTDAAGY
jgi:superfamily II DNA or RNA helicase